MSDLAHDDQASPAVDAAQVERSAAAAWPAGRSEAVAGWLLRQTPGVRRQRSNSALPPAPELHPERTLDAVEAFYRAAGLPALVQVSPAERHAALDATLAARGYRRAAPTLVLAGSAAEIITGTASATPWAAAEIITGTASATPRAAAEVIAETAAGAPWPAAGVLGGSAAVTPGSAGVVIDAAAGGAWLAAYQAFNGPVDTSPVAEVVLARVPSPAGFARIEVDGRAVAIGLFVATGEWAGVFCMATDRAYRRRGLALAVLGAGARWAAAHGCAGLYLQVERGNDAARYLYARAGFTHSHSYHYRVADFHGS